MHHEYNGETDIEQKSGTSRGRDIKAVHGLVLGLLLLSMFSSESVSPVEIQLAMPWTDSDMPIGT